MGEQADATAPARTDAAPPVRPGLAEPPGDAARRGWATIVALAPGQAFRLGFFVAVGVLAALALARVLGTLQGILVVLVVALFAALGLQPVIEWLMGRGLPRAVAAAIVVVGLLALAGLGLWAIVPLVAEQVTTLVTNAPGFLEQLRANPQVAALDARFQVIDRLGGMLASGTWVTDFFGGFLGFGAAAANLAASTGLTLVLLLFFTWTAPSIKEAIYEMAPASQRPRVRYLAGQIFQRIGDYLGAMLIVVTLWGVGSFIALNVVGLGRYSLALALVTAALSSIPAVGALIAMVLCVLVALTVSPGAALGLLAYYVVYLQVDAYLVQPRLFARSLKVPPALVILGAACGMALFGVIGALLAIPTVASLLLLYRELVVPKLDAG